MLDHVDLTHPIEDGMQTYPGDPAVSRTAHATHADDGYHVESLSCGSHTGTHIDAPLHTEPDGDPLSAFSLDRFVFDAVRIDCRDCEAREPLDPKRLPADDVLADADMAVFWTGWDAYWNTEQYLDHPYVAPEMAARCADYGLAVGIDALSPDPTPSEQANDDEPTDFAAHHALLGNDCLIVENLTNLGSVGERFELRAYPLALGGDGAPVRAVGID
ncbi:cyclase family protein [Halonotius terrestris]|uniref:Cyclase family protein n=1 Tax=Halonotius terrestris TaxID=2487750 RepID=A0A8J8PC04_9EURY|nr:cyclase family protein [Halonotius terrestris]TQQ81252.1 cyclase family protein [Halonotius terrestris]